MRGVDRALLLFSLSIEAVTSFHPTYLARPRTIGGVVGRGAGSSSQQSLLSLFQASSSDNDVADLHQFDYLLQETTDSSVQLPVASRRRIAIGNGNDRTIVMASSSSAGAFPGAPTTQEDIIDDDDPYAIDNHMGKFEKFQEQAESRTLESRLKNMDFQDMVLTLAIPSLLAFVSGRWVYNRVANRVSRTADDTLDNFAKEMIYHDGDMDEMKLCIADYKKKLVWMGPKRNDSMLKRYLEQYAKKKTVSPQAIVTLSNVFPLFGYTEAKAAELLVSLCNEMGSSKASSAGKLLFFGNHIFKTAEGRAALKPIRDLIMSTYRDATVAETMIDSSQQAIAEAAYRSTVLKGGKNQSKLTAGWKLLGLDEATATRIFDEQKEEGFVSDRETMYGGQTRKYDKKGNQIEDDGSLANPEDAVGVDDDTQETTSNIYECGQCGFTLFIAEGRESKFYGSDFKCPECGAPKAEFVGRDGDSE